MALFPKSLSRKNPDARGAKGGSANGRAEAAPRGRTHGSTIGGVTITGFGAVDWLPTRRQIEVTQGQPGMCAVLENAVLLYASGHADQALDLLTRGVRDDDETQRSMFAWLALFDLLQRAGKRADFYQLADHYVARFERPPPMWDEQARQTTAPRALGSGYLAVSGKLTASNSAPFDALKRAMARNDSQARFDLASLTDFDDAGARTLAAILAEARRRQYPLRLQRTAGLRGALEAAVAKGQAGGEGAWLLSLELLQWQNDRVLFDDRAVDYAVTFEVSPPSWEPPIMPAGEAERMSELNAAAASAEEAEAAGVLPGVEMVPISGVLTGSNPPQIAAIHEFAASRHVVFIDMREIDRIDFVGAGAVLNACNKLEGQRKAVQIFGATPIIRGILLLIGVPAGHFVKKVA